MFSWLLGAWRTLGYVALSAALIYVSVLVGLRVGERRTLSQMTAYDFAVGVALGTIIGRTATSATPSYVQGVTATVALLAMHNLLSWARFRVPAVRRLVTRAPLVLVRDGNVDMAAMRQARLTPGDLRSALREHGVASLSEVGLLVFEPRGAFSVLHKSPALDEEL